MTLRTAWQERDAKGQSESRRKREEEEVGAGRWLNNLHEATLSDDLLLPAGVT